MTNPTAKAGDDARALAAGETAALDGQPRTACPYPGGVAGLQDRPKPGRPARIDEVAVVLAPLEPPPDRLGVTHWLSRLLAAQLGISNVWVAAIWRKWGLQPWRRETFKFSTDPQLEAKVRDVVGLYLDPPERR